MANKHILIIGGGLGGLCLGQSLKKHGVSFSIFERDGSRSARAQGYRLRINRMGAEALEKCLSQEAWDLFVKTCSNALPKFTQCDIITGSEKQFRGPPVQPGDRNYFADRNTMRGCFMLGIESHIQFDKTFERYELLASGKIRVFFRDGSSEDGDLLVAADGRGSRVRSQYLPEHAPVDLMGRSIYGKTPFTPEIESKLAPCLLDAFGGGSDRTTGLQLFAQVIRFDEDPAITSNGKLESVQDYIYWVLLAKEVQLGVGSRLLSMSKSELKSLTLELTQAWHPSLRCILEDQMEEETAALIVSSAIPTPWQSSSSHVTLLGDSIHAMLPVGGQGANCALNDAAHLCEAIVASGDGPIDVASYEEKMRGYAFKAVEEGYKAGLMFGSINTFDQAQPLPK